MSAHCCRCKCALVESLRAERDAATEDAALSRQGMSRALERTLAAQSERDAAQADADRLATAIDLVRAEEACPMRVELDAALAAHAAEVEKRKESK